MKNRVYAITSYTMEKFKENIETVISSVRAEEMVHVNDIFLWHCLPVAVIQWNEGNESFP